MRRISAWLSVVAIVLLTVGVYAQKPNFSGKWTREAPAGGGGGGGGGGRGGGGGFGMENTITQTDKTLTIEYMGGGQNPAPIKLVYNLDGSDSKNMMPGRGGGAPAEVVSKATWDGAKIVITSGETKRVISMEGPNMVVETTGPGREGAPQTTKAVYKKA
jgi:hypothetical protein